MFGEGSLGEAALGESPGAVLVLLAGVFGTMGLIEAPDVFAAIGSTTIVSSALVADDNVLIVVVELELGQF